MHIDIHLHAREDIRALVKENKPAAAAVLVVLEQLGADPKVIDKLTTQGDNFLPVNRLNVKRWESVRRIGNLWRFRILDTPATSYRVVYGYHWQTGQLCVLAVVHKERFDYDDLESNIARRILGDWRALRG